MNRPLHPLLKNYFGFDQFRPLQEEIIRDALGGRDVFALLPTGGGKSLCFQLAAMAQEGLTVVVSPLIALMKDQVDSLTACGVPATFLNSSLAPGESRERLQGLHRGEFRLLYVAPERLMLPDFIAGMADWRVNLVAIDEAHCISEWGHDFRPEYRKLAELRKHFGQAPIMALTATATTRVREDIEVQLKLHSPSRYVASFNRPNLYYRVVPKKNPSGQLLEFLRERPRESGIIYCLARKTAERVALDLAENGIKAKPYHAGLTPKQRTKHQDLFLRDEVKVICATIAFGMGINKPNVRFVVHYDLPKNLEGYYQETGRAGRDGLPSECLLLFSGGDVVKQLRFIDQKPTPKEREIARTQLNQMARYGESSSCRRRSLLGYFGEEFKTLPCGGCDNCATDRETYDGTLPAHKFLSCVYRIKQKSGIAFGPRHIVDVLRGELTDPVRKWQHESISTFGIGKEHSPEKWQDIARQLIGLGLLDQSQDAFGTLGLSAQGAQLLKARAAVRLVKPDAPAQSRRTRTGQITCDEALFENLVAMRRALADEEDVPTHVILSDVTLRNIAREYPQNLRELGRITGMVRKKVQRFGQVILAEVAAHLQTNGRG